MDNQENHRFGSGFIYNPPNSTKEPLSVNQECKEYHLLSKADFFAIESEWVANLKLPVTND